MKKIMDEADRSGKVYMQIDEAQLEEKNPKPQGVITESNVLPIISIICLTVSMVAVIIALAAKDTVLQRSCIEHYGDWENGYCLFDKPNQ